MSSSSATTRDLIRRRASVQTGMFTKLLHDKDEDAAPNQNSGAWIISCSILESNPGLELVRKTIKERIVAQYARFRSKLVLNAQGEAEFQELGELDWDYHVPQLSFPEPLSKTEFLDYLGDLNSYEYDLDKPLWRYLLIPKLADGTCALLLCVNHALGDGLSLVAVSDALLDSPLPGVGDAKTTPAAADTRESKQQQQYKLDALTKLGIFLYGAFHGATLQFSKPDEPNRLRLDANGKRSTGKKRIAAAEPIPLEKFKAIKTKLAGTTINDVLMGLMTLTLKRFFNSPEGSEGFSPEHKVTAQFPISMRQTGEGGLDIFGEPHNKISYAYFGFDFLTESRIHTVWGVKHQIDCIKYSPAPLVLDKILRLALRVLPTKMVMAQLTSVGKLGTAQLSNVPASQTQIRSFGVNVLDVSFFLFSPLAVYLGILTYNGRVNASFNLDSALDVDPAILAQCWNAEFDLLYEEVMRASALELQRPKPSTVFYKQVALFTLLALGWFAAWIVFGHKLAFAALLGLLVGFGAKEWTRD